jgi:hypothetical protein
LLINSAVRAIKIDVNFIFFDLVALSYNLEFLLKALD